MKIIKKIFKGLAIILVVLALVLFISPLLFKSKLIELAKTEINKNLNAEVDFGRFGLSFFTAFPNLNFVIHDLSISGKGEFEDTYLAKIGKLELKLNPFSLSSDQVGIKSMTLIKPEVQAMVLKNGKANWDIIMESSSQGTESSASGSSFKLTLNHIKIFNGSLLYNDHSQSIKTRLDHLHGDMTGDLSAAITTLQTNLRSENFSFTYAGIDYISHAELKLKGGIEVNLTDSKYSFSNNEIYLNALGLLVNGFIALEDENTRMDLEMVAQKNDFKHFLSAVPALYNEHFKDIEAGGQASITAKVNGIYNSLQSPAFDAKLLVENGSFSYAGLPDSVEDIFIDLQLSNKDGKADHTEIDLRKLHLTFQGNPLDARLKIADPVSDPVIAGSLKGILDLNRIQKLFPMENTEIKGVIESDIKLNGKLSSLEQQRYTDFLAQGQIAAHDVYYKSNDLPEGLKIKKAQLVIEPKQLTIKEMNAGFGNSDFQLKGQLYNYLAYFLKDENLKGNFDLHSNLIDLNELMELQEEEIESTPDSIPTTFEVPKNINVQLRSNINKILYKNAELNMINGTIQIADGILEMKDLKMHMFDGQMSMKGLYESQADKKARIGLDLDINELDIRKTATTFNSIKLLAPVVEKCKGTFSASIDYYNSLLNSNMRPDLKSISAEGRISSKNISIKDSELLKKIGRLLNIEKLGSFTLKDIDISFNIKNGRVETKPFDVEFNNIKARIEGVQNTDQSIDYNMQFSLPYAMLGNAGESIGGLLAKAKASGIDFKETDNIAVNTQITGDVNNPKITFDLDLKNAVVLRAQQQAVALLSKARIQAEELKKKAKISAENIRSEAETQAKKVEEKAEGKLKILQLAAKKAADKIRAEADKKAIKVEETADNKANELLQKAKAEGDKLIENAQKSKK